RGELLDRNDDEGGGRAMKVQEKASTKKKGWNVKERVVENPKEGTGENEVFVGNLGHKVTWEDLKREFQQFGRVLNAKILTDKETKKSLGRGFVTFAKPESVIEAVKWNGYGKDGKDLKLPALTVERRIYVKIPNPRPLQAARRNDRGQQIRQSGQLRQAVNYGDQIDDESDLTESVSDDSLEHVRMTREHDLDWNYEEDLLTYDGDFQGDVYDTESEGY
ncbi:hypothetical protein HDU96_004331, partial [Phlyctochytrium bullatum]